jgi:hypothetical protein
MTKQFSNYSDLITFTRASGGHALRPVSYGDELVTNGTFNSDLSGWTDNLSKWTFSGSRAYHAPNSTFAVLRQSIPLTVGKIYRITFDYEVVQGQLRCQARDSSNQPNSDTLVIHDLTGTGSASVIFVPDSDYDSIGFARDDVGVTSEIYVDNISVKEVLFDQPDGTLTLFEHPNNVPRVEYDADGNRLGLLVEESRTNLVTHSENFSNSSWNNAASGLTVISNAITAPDGTMTADKLQETATSSIHRRGFLVSSSNDKIFSFFAKAGERTKVRTWSFVGSNTYAVTFDLSNGTIVSGSDTGKEGKIEYYGNGWYRCSSKTFDGQAYVVVGPMIDGVNGNNTVNYTGDGSSGVYVWGAQIETNVSFPTSYIKTTGSTATRSADVASIPVADFGYNQSAGSFFIEFSHTDPNGTGSGNYALSTSGSSRFLYNNSGSPSWVNFDGTVSVNFGNLDFDGAFSKVAMGMDKNGTNGVVNGGTIKTSTSTPQQNVTASDDLSIGKKYSSGSHLNGHIKSIKYYPRSLTNAQLQDITT